MENLFIYAYFKLKKCGHNYKVIITVKAFSSLKE